MNAAMPEVDQRIELRRCPKRESVATNGYGVRVTSRTRLQPYALKVCHKFAAIQLCPKAHHCMFLLPVARQLHRCWCMRAFSDTEIVSWVSGQ